MVTMVAHALRVVLHLCMRTPSYCLRFTNALRRGSWFFCFSIFFSCFFGFLFGLFFFLLELSLWLPLRRFLYRLFFGPFLRLVNLFSYFFFVFLVCKELGLAILENCFFGFRAGFRMFIWLFLDEVCSFSLLNFRQWIVKEGTHALYQGLLFFA